MDINIAAIEIKNTCFKLMIGYLYENRIDVLYNKTYPLTNTLKDGDISDLESLTNDLKTIKTISDQQARLKIDINEVVLILPPFGLEVFQTSKTTSTIDRDGKITKTDIANVLNMVRKNKPANENNLIADIIPSSFSCDDNQIYKEPPLGIVSNSLLIDAHVYTLPEKMVNNFKKAVIDAGYGIKRIVIAPLGVNTLLESEHFPTDRYVLVDYNKDNTTVSFFGNGKLYSSNYFDVGGEDITVSIANNFEISMEKAESIKKSYGVDLRENEYKPAILAVSSDDGIVRKYNVEEINEVVLSSLKDWAKLFNNSLSTLLNEYGNMKDDIPLVFIGGASKINGFKELMDDSFPNNKKTYYSYKTVGGNKPGDVNLLGAIAFGSIYKGSLEDESRIEIKQVSREEVKYSENIDEL